MIEIKDIKLLSRVWEIKPKPNVKVNENIFYCCKVRIQNSEPIIIYFNNLGRINGWNTIEVTKKSFMLVRIYEAKDQKAFLDYIQENVLHLLYLLFEFERNEI